MENDLAGIAANVDPRLLGSLIPLVVLGAVLAAVALTLAIAGFGMIFRSILGLSEADPPPGTPDGRALAEFLNDMPRITP